MQFMQVNTERNIDIPLFCSVQAGFPSPAEDCAVQKIDLNKEFIKHPNATFFVRVSGDSMEGKGFFNGDLVIVDRSLEPRNGNIIIAFLNSEFTIKEFQKHDQQITLKPANKKYNDICLKEGDEFYVWGVVTNIIRSV